MDEKATVGIAYITAKHKGQHRKNGEPYAAHPIVVAGTLARKGYSENYVLAALFHDLLEDTDATETEILELSNKKVLDAVKLLTKTPENRKSYIEDILKNDIAKVVKNEDRIHNLRSLKDALPDFVGRYLKNTKKYLGKFSKELDDEYEHQKEMFEKWDEYYEYITDSSIDDGPIYRVEGNNFWVAQKEHWEPVEDIFWAEMGDNVRLLTQDEVLTILKARA